MMQNAPGDPHAAEDPSELPAVGPLWLAHPVQTLARANAHRHSGSRPVLALAGLLLLLATPGCNDGQPGADEPRAAEAPAEQEQASAGSDELPLEEPVAAEDGPAAEEPGEPALGENDRGTDYGKKTTAGSIALTNLDAQLDGYAKSLATNPGNPSLTKKVVDLRLVRAQFTGNTDDYTKALSEARAAADANPTSAAVWTTLASVEASTHRFPSALKSLDRAIEAGASVEALATKRWSIELALGRAGAAEKLRELAQKSMDSRPSYGAALQLASANWQLGDYDAADAAFVAAAEAYRNTAPFALAYVDFERGKMWAETADQPEKAKPLYAAAIARLPGYHTATVHHAEILAEEGDVDTAIALLRPVAEKASDPEPAALLSHLLAGRGATEEAQKWLERATKGYERVLAEHPEGFADHGAEFFDRYEPDPAKAIELARQNLELRPTADAFELAIAVTTAGGDPADACALAERAVSEVRPNPVLLSTVREALEACGRQVPSGWKL